MINVNVATNNKSRAYGLGVIIRDSTSEIICARAIY